VSNFAHIGWRASLTGSRSAKDGGSRKDGFGSKAGLTGYIIAVGPSMDAPNLTSTSSLCVAIAKSLVGARVERISSARAPEMCPF
jgi:hypothetical protein